MSKTTIFYQFYKSPLGELIIGSHNGKLVLCDWRYRKMRSAVDSRIKSSLKADYVEESSSVIDTTITQIEEYLKNERTEFNIPLQLIGTNFQKSVWCELQKIPFGKTESYLGLSKKLGNVKAIRAVASANGANAISIVIPCHRIIGSKGELTGYAGGLFAKKKLLELEGSNKQLGLF